MRILFFVLVILFLTSCQNKSVEVNAPDNKEVSDTIKQEDTKKLDLPAEVKPVEDSKDEVKSQEEKKQPEDNKQPEEKKED